MNLLWAALIVAVVSAVATSAMLFVRRRAPEGSYFEDGDRAAGVFGVLATGFAVLLGMMGSVAIVITSTLLLLWFLDNPYHHGAGGLRPVAMERTLGLLRPTAGIASRPFEIPCTPLGTPRTR